MSRLSPDLIDVALAPSGIQLVRHSRLTRRQRARAEQRFPAPQGLGTVLAQLDDTLHQPDWRGAGGLRLILSNHWLHFAVIPWSDALTRPAERLALAQGVLEEIYGEQGEQAIRISESGVRRPALAAALAADAMRQLRQMAQAHALRLVSLQPLLMQSFTACRSQLSGGDTALACLEPGRLTLLTTARDRWQSIQSRSLPYEPSPAVGPVLTQLFAQLEQLPQLTVLIGCGLQTTLQSVAGMPVNPASTGLAWPTPAGWN